MTPLFQKMNLKDTAEIVVLNAPESFAAETEALEGVQIARDLAQVESVVFLLAFVTRLAEIEHITQTVALKAKGDVVVWFAYPKGSSKNYTCEFNRDTGWIALGEAGFEGVRQVAIDADWSALRFRRVEYIKTLARHPKRRMTATSS
jgi:hypothetical protein